MSFWKILGSGDILGAVKKLIALLEGSPELHQFIDQFSSDFGKQALVDGKAFVISVSSGTPIMDAAKELATTLVAQGLDTAGHDAETVAANALGVLLRAPGA